MKPARLLVTALRDPASVAALDAAGWHALLTCARAETLIGTLAHRLAGVATPDAAARILDDARAAADQGRRAALWEAEMARRALAGTGVPLILLKGTAFAAAGLSAGEGRQIGDLDILVPHDALPVVERRLLAAGWEWVKPDAYTDHYYRAWMHELAPLIHRERDRMIDVHHTILPLTARPRPDAAALVADIRPIRDGVAMLSAEDILVHAAAHLFADGDLAGGLRNLWDVDRLLRESDAPGFQRGLMDRAAHHGLAREVARALRLSARLYGTPIDRTVTGRDRPADALYIRRLLARDGWGRPTRKLLRFAFYIRSHWLRMPPAMLARHLAVKAGLRRPDVPARG